MENLMHEGLHSTSEMVCLPTCVVHVKAGVIALFVAMEGSLRHSVKRCVMDPHYQGALSERARKLVECNVLLK